MSGVWNPPAAARNWNRPLSRFPLGGQAGGTPPLAALGRVKAPAKSKAARGGLGRKGRMLLNWGLRPDCAGLFGAWYLNCNSGQITYY